LWDPSNLSTATLQSLPIIAFTIGLTGSLHCVGMCGPLAISAGKNNFHLWGYQFGRLCGYLLIGSLVSLLGTQVSRLLPDWTTHLVGTFLGAFFVYMGLQVWRKKDSKMPPAFASLFSKTWIKLMPKKSPTGFIVGALSIFLPCGLLYGFFLAILALQNPWYGMAAILFFWLGTLPAMMLGPTLAHKIFSPISSKFPLTISLLLISLGISTITYRAWGFVQACH